MKSVYSGTVLKHNVRVYNSGTGPLDIYNIAVSCGCTTTDLKKHHLDPNDTTDLTIRFDTQHFVGSVTKSITIVSNDPVRRNLEVQFHSTIRSIFDINPIPVYFGKLPVGQLTTVSMGIKNLEKQKIAIVSVFDSAQMISVSPGRETLNPSDSIEVHLSVTPDQAGPFAGHLVFTTDSKKQRRITIPYYYIAVPERNQDGEQPQH